jgi:hypothetical protein
MAMGKARSGTESNAERRFGIKVRYHALESIRERLNLLGSGTRFSAEPDTSISLRIAEAVSRGPSTRYVCDGEEHECVDLRDSFETDLVAFVRNRSVVTVLTVEQARRSIETGNWTRRRAA